MMRRNIQALSTLGALLLGLSLLDCASKPVYTYDVRPWVSLETARTIAFDPRELAWVSEGQHRVRAESLKPLVRDVLEARGYRMVEPEAADLWLEVVVMRPDKGGEHRGAEKSGSGGRGGGRAGGGMRGTGRGDHGMGRAAGSPEVAPARRAMFQEGFDPGGEFTFTVQLLTRENTQDVWTGCVYLPAQKKGEQPDRRTSMKSVVEQLLRPVPTSRTAEAK